MTTALSGYAGKGVCRGNRRFPLRDFNRPGPLRAISLTGQVLLYNSAAPSGGVAQNMESAP